MPDTLLPDLGVTTGPLPASRKIHVDSKRIPGVRVAMREIDLTEGSGEPPVRVYDTSGPYSDPAIITDIRRGLPELRRPWILGRGDVEEYEGRDIKPEDVIKTPSGVVKILDFGLARAEHSANARLTQTGVVAGRAEGQFHATGKVPAFLDRLHTHGIDLPEGLFSPRVLGSDRTNGGEHNSAR